MDVFDLVAKIRLDSSEYEQGVGKAKGTFSTLASGVKTGLTTVAKVGAAAVTAGVAGVTALTKMGVEGYAQYEQLVGGVETLFKESGNAVMKYAENAYKTSGLSSNAYMETVTSFSASLIKSLDGDTAKAAKVADMAITDMSDNANKMGTSIDMIQNAYNGFAKGNFTMLDNLKLGYGGTQEEMKKLLKDAEKISGIKYDISSFSDISEAIHVIQQDLEISGISYEEAMARVASGELTMAEATALMGTTAREAATTIEGSLSMMKGAWENLVVGMADGNADMELLINNFVESTATAAQNLIPRIEQTLAGIGELITGLAPVIADALPQLVETVLPSLLEAAVSLVGSLIAAAPELVSSFVSAVSQFVTEKIPEMFPGLAASVEVLKGYFTDIGNYMSESFAPIFEDVSYAFGVVKDAVQPLIDKLVEYVSGGEAAEDASNLLKDAIDFVADAYQSVKDFINDTITAFQDACTWVEEHKLGLEILASVIGIVTAAIVAYNVAQTIANAGGAAMIALNASTTIGYYALVAAETVATAATSAFGAVMAFVTSPITLVVAAIAAVIAIIVLCVKHWDEITAAVSKAWEKIKTWTSEATDAITKWISNAWENIKKWTSDVWNGIKTIISNVWEGIKSGVSKALEAVKTVISSVWEGIKNTVSTILDAIKTGMTNAWNSIKNIVTTVIDSVRNFISTAWEAIKTIITSVMNIISSVIKGDWEGVRNSVSNIVTSIKSVISSGLNGALSIISSILDGIKGKFTSIFDNCKTIVKNAIDAIKKVFNFSWSLPKLKLPHISVSGGVAPYGIGGKGSLPKFSIQWYKKAYDNAMILSKPTIFGYSEASGKFLGGGDGNGNEIVAGESYLMGLISNAVESKNERIVTLLAALLEATVDGNTQTARALMADRTFAVGEREFARLVKQYA